MMDNNLDIYTDIKQYFFLHFTKQNKTQITWSVVIKGKFISKLKILTRFCQFNLPVDLSF